MQVLCAALEREAREWPLDAGVLTLAEQLHEVVRVEQYLGLRSGNESLDGLGLWGSGAQHCQETGVCVGSKARETADVSCQARVDGGAGGYRRVVGDRVA